MFQVVKVTVEAARGTLGVATAATTGAQQVVDTSRRTLDAAIGVLEGTRVKVHQSCDIGVTAAVETLAATREANSFGLEVAEKVEATEDIVLKKATQALDSARGDVSVAQQACDAARTDFNSAQADVNSAQLNFDNAVASLDAANHALESENANFDSAVADLEEQQRNCQPRDCDWWDAPCHAYNAGLAVCQAALEIAKGVVEVTRQTLSAAQLAATAAQQVADNSSGTLDVAKGVLGVTETAMHGSCDIGVSAAEETLVTAQEMAEKATLRVLGGVLDIQDLGFNVLDILEMGLGATAADREAETGSIDGWMMASFFGGNPLMTSIPINILSIDDMASSVLVMIQDLLGGTQPPTLSPPLPPQPPTAMPEPPAPTTLPGPLAPPTTLPEALPPTTLGELGVSSTTTLGRWAFGDPPPTPLPETTLLSQPQPPASGGILPELQQLLTDAVEGSYTVSPDCTVILALSGCRLDITCDPEFCLTVGFLLSDVLPNLSLDDYRSGVASDLLNVAVSSSYVDRCEDELSISGGTTQPIAIVPSVATLHEFSVFVTYTLPSSFNALFSGVWSIGDVDFTVTLEKSDDGFTLSGTVAEITGVTTDRLITGLTSFVPGNDVSDLFHLLKLDSISVTDINVEVMIVDGGYSLELDFKTNILDSQVFFFLSSAQADDGSTTQSFSMGMSVKSVRFGDLIRDVVDDNVVVPIISDIIIPEAALLGTTSTPELDYPVPLLNEVASELSSGLGIAFTMKLSDDVPFGTFFLGFDGNSYMFKVLSDETVPVSALLSKVITSFTSISLPAQLPVADVLAGSLKSFEYDTDTDVMTVTADVDDTLVIIENVLVLEDLTASFQLEKQSPSSGNSYDFSFELESVWTIGQLTVALSVARDPTTLDYSATGSVQDELPVGALIQEFGASFLPLGPLRDILLGIGLEDFSIVDPSVSIMFGQEFAVHLGGSAVIGDWSSTVEMIVGRVQSNLVMAAGVTLSNIGIVPAVSKLTGGALDISVIPGASILSQTSVAFAVSPSTMPRDQHLTMSSPLLADVNINQGVSIAASFTLPADCGQDFFCKVVKKLLGADIELNLLATLTTVSDLYMRAVVGTPVSLADGIVMQDVGFEIEVGTTNNAIGITGSLEFETPPVILRGGIGVSQSGGYLRMSSEGMWNEAFGLDFLAIGDIIFELSITPEPTVIASLEFGGRAIIGYQNNPSATTIEGSAYIGVNKIDPRQNYCSGSISVLTVPAILRAFGQTFQLPSFLEEIGFPDGASISFSAIEQTLPNGVTIPQGFFFSGTLQILSFSVSADIKLDSTSLYAKVTVSSFDIGNGLIQISGSGSETGPILKVDISWIPIHAELLIDGSVTVLGIHASTIISMDASRTYFYIEGSFLGMFSASLEIEASYGSLKEAHFSATGTFKNDLFSTLRDKVEGALDKLVKEANEALDGARSDVSKAHQDCDSARGPFNDAQADVDRAQRDFDNAVADMEGAKRDLDNEKRKFDDAVADLDQKQRSCAFRDCEWYDVPCHTYNAGLAVCQAALEIAKGTVEATKHTLDVAKLAVSGAQVVVDNSRWTLDAAKGVLEGTKVTVHATCDVGVYAAEGTLIAVRETHEFGIKVAERAINGVLGGVLDIREMGFHVTVAVAQTGSFEGWMKVSFFGDDPVTMDIAIKIFSIEDMVTAICDVVKDIVGA
ncbi:uncharacterized protein [Branchiostoma lanceolatum]|uniref:uncharacterized protein n=1 Tax=Branchiostoma lanceolatum TaxID=7740 RepID=UPI0034545652